jgi:hypothetical protein
MRGFLMSGRFGWVIAFFLSRRIAFVPRPVELLFERVNSPAERCKVQANIIDRDLLHMVYEPVHLSMSFNSRQVETPM